MYLFYMQSQTCYTNVNITMDNLILLYDEDFNVMVNFKSVPFVDGPNSSVT